MGDDEVVFTKGDMDAARPRPPSGSSRPTVQPPRHHHAMETSGTVARWDGDG